MAFWDFNDVNFVNGFSLGEDGVPLPATVGVSPDRSGNRFDSFHCAVLCFG